jgi:hypothetical protein
MLPRAPWGWRSGRRAPIRREDHNHPPLLQVGPALARRWERRRDRGGGCTDDLLIVPAIGYREALRGGVALAGSGSKTCPASWGPQPSCLQARRQLNATLLEKKRYSVQLHVTDNCC